jgi:hypothetical protein
VYHAAGRRHQELAARGQPEHLDVLHWQLALEVQAQAVGHLVVVGTTLRQREWFELAKMGVSLS